MLGFVSPRSRRATCGWGIPRRSAEVSQTATQSNVVRALSAQIAELKQRHRAETEHLQAALAAAQGENLELRRQLGRQSPRATAASSTEPASSHQLYPLTPLSHSRGSWTPSPVPAARDDGPAFRAFRVSGAIRAEYRAKRRAGLDAGPSDIALADLATRRQCRMASGSSSHRPVGRGGCCRSIPRAACSGVDSPAMPDGSSSRLTPDRLDLRSAFPTESEGTFCG